MATTSLRCRRIAAPRSASRVRSRSCSRSPAFPSPTTSLSAPTCAPRTGRAAAAAARDVAALVGLTGELDKPAGSLTVAGRKRLELARALATRPRMLLLDEVLAGLNPSEIRDMIPIVPAIRDQGVTILMIEHVMQAVMSLCDPIYVLSQGRIIAGGRLQRSPPTRR